MAIYMKYGEIEGDVTAEGHEGWIEVNSFQFGVGRGIGSPTGRKSDRETSSPSVSEITVTKSSDKTTPLLFQEALQGEGVQVDLHFVRTSAGTLEVFYEVTLTNTLVSGFSQSSGGDNPSESLSLNFTKIEVKFTPINEDHSKGTPVPAGYDLSTATST
jgi:type VI secretion system secreted protein Hcp